MEHLGHDSQHGDHCDTRSRSLIDSSYILQKMDRPEMHTAAAFREVPGGAAM